MNAIKASVSILIITACVALSSGRAAAQPVPTSCGAEIDRHFLASHWLDVAGTRVSSRGNFGFATFTMDSGFNLATTPLNTPAAAARSVFAANKGTSHFTGPFREVFPGRGNNDVDQWDFWIYRTGALWLRSITWGGGWMQLQNVTCYRGQQNQTLITATSYSTTWGTDFWVFVAQGRTLD